MIAAVLLVWVVVKENIETDREARLARLREMHRQGRAPDYEALLLSPDDRSRKRLIDAALLFLAVVGATEWLLYRSRGG
jgi:hypothetical protein